jgi:hypothetical protein
LIALGAQGFRWLAFEQIQADYTEGKPHGARGERRGT